MTGAPHSRPRTGGARYRRAVGDDLIGAVLEGRYKVVERVAEGAMGIVYRGERVKLGRAVAIKFLHAWNADDAAARKRFEVEARAMARLEHPNCAAVIDVGEYDGAPYVVMDYVRGTTLRDVLDEGPIDAARAADITKQVLSGLAHAHELGIVHRDIKPANIMLSEKVGIGEMVKILDFGLARLRGSTGSLTVGIAIGTPSYMSPEQIGGDTVDARTDLYACGVLLFEMLTGDKPFVADEPLDVLRMHREAQPPRASERAPAGRRDEVRPFDDVILRALAKKPEDRFASAAELAAAIDGALRARERLREVSSSQAHGALPTPPAGDARDRSLAAEAPALAPPRAEAAPHRERPPMDPVRRRALIGVGLAVVGLAAIGVIAAVAGGGHQAASIDAAPAIAVVPPDAPDPSDDVLARARAMVENGDSDGAIHLLDSARRTYPDRAVISFELGRLYFARLWWRDGLDAFRAAIRADPGFRTDPDLIKTVLRGFITTPDTDEGMARFLRNDIGEAAIPYLQETAQSHPSDKVRARAAALLERYR